MSEVATAAAPTAETAPNSGAENATQPEGTTQGSGTAAQQTVAENPQKKGESDSDYELRLSKLLLREKSLTRESQQHASNAEKYRQLAAQHEAELKAARAELEKAKTRKGITRAQFIRLSDEINRAEDEAAIAKMFDEDEPEIPAALAKEIAELKRENAERKKQDEERQQQEAQEKQGEWYDGQVKIVRKIMDELTESGDCPLFVALPKFAPAIYNIWYDRWQRAGGTPEVRPDIYAIAKQYHNLIADDLATALESDKARSFLSGLKPGLKALLGGQEARTSSPPSETRAPAEAMTPRQDGSLITRRKAKDSSSQAKTKFEREREERQRARSVALEYVRSHGRT